MAKHEATSYRTSVDSSMQCLDTWPSVDVAHVLKKWPLGDGTGSLKSCCSMSRQADGDLGQLARQYGQARAGIECWGKVAGLA